MDAYDADVLIYAASPDHPLGRRMAAHFASWPQDDPVGIGSVLLLPEVVATPLRLGLADEVTALLGVLARIELLPVDAETAELATGLAASHSLRAADAVHLATAVGAGADRFITNIHRDFGSDITEIEIVGPEQLHT